MTGRSEAAEPVSRFLPPTMASALFMDQLDTAALGSALPTMAREFHTEALQLKLALTAYLMTMAILVPASGWRISFAGLPVYTRLAAQARAHMRNARKVSP
jgi:MFS family permease